MQLSEPGLTGVLTVPPLQVWAVPPEPLSITLSQSHLICTFSCNCSNYHALPISNLGLRMDDSTIRAAVGLRLGLPLAHPHFCGLCGAEVDQFSTHGLSCKKSKGRHASLNDVLYRAFHAAKIPARLEPSGLARSDGKRPDGITMVPWESGRCIVWDVTCVDTLAPTYRSDAVIAPGSVAARAERKKETKYNQLTNMYKFIPIAIETLGAMAVAYLGFGRRGC